MGILSQLLAVIPSHHEEPLSAAQIWERAQKCYEGKHLDRSTVDLLLEVLSLFNCLECRQGKFRSQNQIANYFLKSLSWYNEMNQPLCVNWRRVGTAGYVTSANLLDRAPYLFKAMEERRFELMRSGGLSLRESRTQPCSIIFIKAKAGNRQFYLHQWDQDANRFQLIGGKKRENEEPLETAVREFQEEVSHNDLIHGQDFMIHTLFGAPVSECSVSNTYGALTRYEIFLFWAQIKRPKFELGAGDRWITLDEMKAEITSDGRKIAGIYKHLTETQLRHIEHMPTSLPETGDIESFVDYLDLKPGIFGVRIDLNKIIKRLMGRN